MQSVSFWGPKWHEDQLKPKMSTFSRWLQKKKTRFAWLANLVLIWFRLADLRRFQVSMFCKRPWEIWKTPQSEGVSNSICSLPFSSWRLPPRNHPRKPIQIQRSSDPAIRLARGFPGVPAAQGFLGGFMARSPKAHRDMRSSETHLLVGNPVWWIKEASR